jgi:ligand-binding sensor domain-containing protein/signal transduction histidine kinase/CheY-like chemotaxis protein/AraC-like DNA-binding protein
MDQGLIIVLFCVIIILLALPGSMKRYFLIKIAIFLSLTGLGSAAFLQAQTLDFSHLSVEENLSQSSVYAITQDAKGFMWFGTRDGLNRYDSRNIVVYRKQQGNQNSLSSSSITALLTDRKGRTWVGTSSGLNLYDPIRDQFTSIMRDTANPQSLWHNAIGTLLMDSYGDLWVGTSQGLNRMRNAGNFEFDRLLKRQPDGDTKRYYNVRAIFEDRDKTLWIGTTTGITKVTRLAGGGFSEKHYSLEKYDSPGYQQSNWINAIAEDKDGRLWLGTEKKGIAVFDKQQEKVVTWQPIPSMNTSSLLIRTIKTDPQGNFWIGGMSGLFVVSPDARHFRHYTNSPDNPRSLSDHEVRSMFMTREGTFWIGTHYGGVNYHNALSRQFGFLKLDGQYDRVAFKIGGPMTAAADGNFWVGTEDNGLYLVNKNQQVIRHYLDKGTAGPLLSSGKIKSLLKDGEQGLWIGTIRGLNYLDISRNRITQYLSRPGDTTSIADDRIYALSRDAQGRLWIATYQGGLSRFDAESKTFIRFRATGGSPAGLLSNNVTSLLLDSKKRLWVGTTKGLSQKLGDKEGFAHYKDLAKVTEPTDENYVNTLFEDSKKRLWIGTRGSGLHLFVPGVGTIRHFDERSGLPGKNILGIQEDTKGNLWISSENGLSKFDTRRTFTNYDKNDGLICKEYIANSIFKDSLGTLYFGGFNGIVRFKPDSIRSNPHVPALVFTGLKLFNKNVLPGPESPVLAKSILYTDHITLNYLQNVFSIEFAALNYIEGPKNRYAYQLVGFDKEWNTVKDPVATYMNLEPGEYTLLVKGANNNGLWNSKPLQMKVTVLPPPWKTAWAYLIYICIFLGLLYTWARFNKVKVQLGHELELEHLEKRRRNELHQTKINFFTNIIHEIRTPLTLIMGPVGELNEEFGQNPAVRKQLRVMKESTNRLRRLVEQLLDFQKHEIGNVCLKVQKHDLNDWLQSTCDSFHSFAALRGVKLHFEPDPAQPELWFDGGEMEKVFHNLIANAVKFTPTGGEIAISIKTPEDQLDMLQVIVEDNGIGIGADDLNKIFHRFYQADNPSRHESGFGIGLALSKNIVELHHGTILAESMESVRGQRGYTRFIISLPFGNQVYSGGQLSCISRERDYDRTPEHALPGMTDLENILQTEEVQSKKAGPRKPLVMIVEDQEDLRAYLKSLLCTNYQVIEAPNGSAAWDEATSVLPDLIISDVAMPVMDGVEFTRLIKTDNRTSHIPVILLTARDTLAHQVTGFETGADDYVTKPFYPKLLLTRVQNLLRLREELKEKFKHRISMEPVVKETGHPDELFLNRLMAIIEENLGNPDFNLAEMVSEIGMSRPVLFRKIKMLTGYSIMDLVRSVRLKKAKILLLQKAMSISEVAFTVGFSDPKHFSKTFRNEFGKSPSEYMDNPATSS